MLQKIITACFYLLFFLTPLLFTKYNHELFEYNKMMVVYLLTVVVSGCWLIRMIRERTFLVKRTPLLVPVLIFLVANFLSTIISIDPHTSIWGYYTRSNGGLLSIISYSILFLALVSLFEAEQCLKFVKWALYSGLAVALYAIPEHFGVSPSCVILYHQFNAGCWVQDVQARVFATLGQPNWLAAYLGMLIFPAIYFAISAKNRFQATCYLLLTTIYYMAFTFAYSRGATLGLLAGLAVFGVPHIYRTMIGNSRAVSEKPGGNRGDFRVFLMVVGAFLVVNLLFGSALTRFQLLSQVPAQVKPSGGGVTQLENGGTESGQIRLIVWKGALEIFKHYPLFGSGVETFAYSYYQYRPIEHNLVSEWDFLYNKAHNEFLNYLATTGVVGFGAYILLIGTFIVWAVKKVLESRGSVLIIAILASYVSYLVQNVFGFSVVIIAMFFYLFPAIAMVVGGSTEKIDLVDLKIPGLKSLLAAFDRRRQFGRILGVVAIVVIGLMSFLGVFNLAKMWLADTLFASGSNYEDTGNIGQAYNKLQEAVLLNPDEPLYRSELGFAAASAALAVLEQDGTRSGELEAEALDVTQTVLRENPNNTSFLRTAIRTYFELASLDPQFNQATVTTFDEAIKHAPTDAKLYYNKALVLQSLNMNTEAEAVFQKTLELKPNYRDAHFSFGLFYDQIGEKQKAIEELNVVLKLIPNDPDALSKLKELESNK